jgi:hypothetical protein
VIDLPSLEGSSMTKNNNVESAKRQPKRLVGRLNETECEEALRLLLDLSGPRCPYCNAVVPGLKLVWVSKGAQPQPPVCCVRCRQWFSPPGA